MWGWTKKGRLRIYRSFSWKFCLCVFDLVLKDRAVKDCRSEYLTSPTCLWQCGGGASSAEQLCNYSDPPSSPSLAGTHYSSNRLLLKQNSKARWEGRKNNEMQSSQWMGHPRGRSVYFEQLSWMITTQIKLRGPWVMWCDVDCNVNT